MNENIFFILALLVFLTGCASYGKCPKPPMLPEPKYAIHDIDKNSTNEEKAKAIVITNDQCMTALKQCNRYLQSYQ